MPKPQFSLPSNFTADDVQRFVEDLARLLVNLTISDGTVPRGQGQNLDLVLYSGATVGVNADFTFNHQLGRVPVGFIVIGKSAACDIYTGSVAWTTTQMTLKATVNAVNFKILIF